MGAVDRSGDIFELSSRGPTAKGETKPDLVTMGVNVTSALAGSKNGKSSISGTSMAVTPGLRSRSSAAPGKARSFPGGCEESAAQDR